MALPASAVRTLDVTLAPVDLPGLVTGDGDAVFLPATSEARAGERIVVTLRFEGHAESFELEGAVTAVRAAGRRASLPAGLVVAFDDRNRERLARAVAWCRGESISWTARAHRRMRVHLEADVVIGGEKVQLTTRDLGPGGAGFRSPEVLPSMGERVGITLRLPGQLRRVRLVGQVRWLDFFQHTRGFGVEFIGGSGRWCDRLEKWVSRRAA